MLAHFGVVTAGVSTHFEVLPHRHRREDAAAFRALADAEPDDMVGAHPGKIPPLEQDLPALRADEAGDGSRVVDLPAPLAPMRVTVSPSSTPNDSEAGFTRLGSGLFTRGGDSYRPLSLLRWFSARGPG